MRMRDTHVHHRHGWPSFRFQPPSLEGDGRGSNSAGEERDAEDRKKLGQHDAIECLVNSLVDKVRCKTKKAGHNAALYHADSIAIRPFPLEIR
jgi:hypothetical protein